MPGCMPGAGRTSCSDTEPHAARHSGHSWRNHLRPWRHWYWRRHLQKSGTCRGSPFELSFLRLDHLIQGRELLLESACRIVICIGCRGQSLGQFVSAGVQLLELFGFGSRISEVHDAAAYLLGRVRSQQPVDRLTGPRLLRGFIEPAFLSKSLSIFAQARLQLFECFASLWINYLQPPNNRWWRNDSNSRRGACGLFFDNSPVFGRNHDGFVFSVHAQLLRIRCTQSFLGTDLDFDDALQPSLQPRASASVKPTSPSTTTAPTRPLPPAVTLTSSTGGFVVSCPRETATPSVANPTHINPAETNLNMTFS